mmetsp:Transcript_19552/g.33568  ORF Transcript_19552/g.33568 Transcript_19552/m.33568 type:complete len:222 (-) Transcript_19552:47-712(-)
MAPSWRGGPKKAPDDSWEQVRESIQEADSRTRSQGADFLAYRLLDVMVDRFYVCLGKYQEQVELLDNEVMKKPSSELILRIHAIDRELLMLRRSVVPIQDLVEQMRASFCSLISDYTKKYLRDTLDHTSQIIDVVENYREFAKSMQEVCSNILSQRLNEIMKILTMISTVFIPGTFYAGVYGMNLEHIPEIHWEYMYPTFWLVVLFATASLFWLFKRNNMI